MASKFHSNYLFLRLLSFFFFCLDDYPQYFVHSPSPLDSRERPPVPLVLKMLLDVCDREWGLVAVAAPLAPLLMSLRGCSWHFVVVFAVRVGYLSLVLR